MAKPMTDAKLKGYRGALFEIDSLLNAAITHPEYKAIASGYREALTAAQTTVFKRIEAEQLRRVKEQTT